MAQTTITRVNRLEVMEYNNVTSIHNKWWQAEDAPAAMDKVTRWSIAIQPLELHSPLPQQLTPVTDMNIHPASQILTCSMPKSVLVQNKQRPCTFKAYIATLPRWEQ
eukprot:15334694-Ditylum_brightwellii.AAC.1